MELFTINDANMKEKKTQMLMLTLTVNRPLVKRSVTADISTALQGYKYRAVQATITLLSNHVQTSKTAAAE